MSSNAENASINISECMTASEVLQKSNLNWDVEKQPVFLKNGKLVNDNYAVVRKDNGIALSVVGNVWQPFQNRELALTIESLVSEKLASFKRGWCWDGGRKSGISASIPKRLVLFGVDELEIEMKGHTSFDGSSPTYIEIGVVRLICSNGLTRFVKNGFVKAKHSMSQHERITLGKHALGLAVNSLDDVLNQAEKLGRIQANKSMIESFLKAVNLERKDDESTQRLNQRERLISLFSGHGIGLNNERIKGSLWALYNAATEYIDHKNGLENTEKKAISSVYGAGAMFKERALNSVLELAR